MSEEETYRMRFRCKNCFNEFTWDIPYGEELKVKRGYGFHIVYYGFSVKDGTKIACPKCGTHESIYKSKEKEEKRREREEGIEEECRELVRTLLEAFKEVNEEYYDLRKFLCRAIAEGEFREETARKIKEIMEGEKYGEV